jgi:hypothetical protein
MLTDIFADRYHEAPLWKSFEESDRKLLVQAFRVVCEQLFPLSINGLVKPRNNEKWDSIHDKLSMELGLDDLSPRYFELKSTVRGNPASQMHKWTIDKVCKNFMHAGFENHLSADKFMKDRISFFELAFREREEELKKLNSELPQKLIEASIESKRVKPGGIRIPGDRANALKLINERDNQEFRNSVGEFNERLRQSGCGLHYHNGFIQRSVDDLGQSQIETPFWALVSEELWKNVDLDMKEAIDRRDNNARDPAWYAARSLESTIKIASDEKGWTHGSEKGAHSYIDNLSSKKNGLLDAWEGEALKHFFTGVRNPLGHGPGGEKMPELNPNQSTWAIEACMGWIKSIIQRL